MSLVLIPLLKNAILALPLALAALAASRWSRRPALAHLLWVLVLVKLVTPPLIDVPLGWRLDVEGWLGLVPHESPSEVAQAAADMDSNGQRRQRPSEVNGPASARSKRRHSADLAAARSSNTPPWLGLLSSSPGRWQLIAFTWIGGSVLVAGGMAVRAWRFHRFLLRHARPHETLGPRVGELAQDARIGISPQVVVIDGVLSPALWTLGRRACLIFPARLAERLRPAELDALLLHELSHFARGDHWVRVLELAARVLFWWHPVVWLARRELEAAEEQCCDAWVVENQSGARHTYAEAILATIDFLHEPAPALPPMACGLGDVPLLRARLTQIMRGNIASRPSRLVTVMVVLAGIVVSPLEPALWAKSSASGAKPAAGGQHQATAAARSKAAAASARRESKQLIAAAAPPNGSSTAAKNASSSVPRRPALAPPVLIWAAATSRGGKFKLEARTGRRTTLLQSDSEFRLDMTAHQITCSAFAPDSITFATGHEDGLVRRWDSETGGLIGSYKGSQAAITSVQFGPGGKLLAAGTKDGTVIVWDAQSAEETARFTSPRPISCLRWSSRGDKLAIAAGDWPAGESARLYLWSPSEDLVVAEQSLSQPAGAIDWLARDDSLIIAAWSGQAQIWNVTTKEFLPDIQLEKDQVSAAAWSPDCRLVTPWLMDQLSSGTSP